MVFFSVYFALSGYVVVSFILCCLCKLDIKMFAWCVHLLRNLCTEVKLYTLQNAHKKPSKFWFLFIMDAVSDCLGGGEGGSRFLILNIHS